MARREEAKHHLLGPAGPGGTPNDMDCLGLQLRQVDVRNVSQLHTMQCHRHG